MKKDREGMFFCFGIISLIVAIISDDISAMLVFGCITILCFYKARKMIFRMFSKPIIKRIIKLKKTEKDMIKKLEERSIAKDSIDNFIMNNKSVINDIKQYESKVVNYNIKIDNLHKREKGLNEKISELQEKKRTLEGFMEQEQIIARAIEDKKQLLEILTDKTSYLENQKKKLQTELSDLREQIIPLQKRIEFSLNTNLDYIDSLTGIEFEQYFSRLLFFLGYQSNCTNATSDYGLDVIAIKDGIKYGFQCKLYSQNVGNDAVQEALSGKLYYNCHVAIVVTNNYFTHNAIKQAEKSNVVLWDRDKLEEILEQFKNEDIYINK